MIVSEKGIGKCTLISEFSPQNRGGKGVKCYRITEKSGNLNLGVEGIVFMGGAFGLAGAYSYEALVGVGNSNAFVAILIAIISAFLAGAVASALFSFLTITLRANQNVTGLALTILGTGVAKFTGEYMRHKVGGFVTLSNPLKEAFAFIPMPAFLQNIPIIGKILFSQTFFFYLAVILAVIMHLFFQKTKTEIGRASCRERV